MLELNDQWLSGSAERLNPLESRRALAAAKALAMRCGFSVS
jgi:hypothetical protein